MQSSIAQKEETGTAGQTKAEEHAFMQRALELASRGFGYSSPNPAVGAVIVREGRIVGEGYHRKAGMPHAEVEALRSAGGNAKGGSLYVTLEPCNHFGLTPPCTEAIIAAGIARVVYAIEDPNPHVTGRGHQRLRQAGIIVKNGLCEEAARYLNRFFFHYITTGMPYTIAKFAISLDGKIATRTGESRWITGSEARKQGHILRHQCDGIVVGAGTVLADNPRLTVRLDDIPDACHPTRILLDSQGRVPADAWLFRPDLPGETLVATTENMPESHREVLAKIGVKMMVLPASPDGRVDLHVAIHELGKLGLISLIVEGGGELLGSFFQAGLVDEVWAFIAPIIIGGETAPGPVGGLGCERLAQALNLQDARVERLGQDFLIKGLSKPKRYEGLPQQRYENKTTGKD
jgi:diaminohydroxyphosphoribosylaminopyrimidine deaminase / 5-amino-6-(5-phosphoribosylamino)uracil reductase